MTENSKQYGLNDKERKEWYENVVKPFFLEGKQKSDKPVFVLLTGQPGAGKTTASAKYAQMLDPEPVKFSGDEIRSLLPYAGELLENDPNQYPFITKADMSWARQKLVSDTFNSGYNLQMDSILSNPNDWKMGTLLEAKNTNYQVECVALGVHRYLSEVSMFARREEQIKSIGVGFPVTMPPHDIAYEILPDVVSRMYREGVADKVSVYNRVFENYYDTDNINNKDKNQISNEIIQSIIKSRDDYLSKDSLNYIQATWGNVYQNMIDRNAPSDQLREAVSYYKAFRKNSGMYLISKENSGLSALITARKDGYRK